MTTKTKTTTRARRTRPADRLFRAFAQPTRLRILHLLRDGEICVGDLVEILGVPQPTASRHLAYLRRAGLVVARESGRFIHYRLAEASDPLHERLIGCVAACFDDVPALARDAARRRRLARRPKCC